MNEINWVVSKISQQTHKMHGKNCHISQICHRKMAMYNDQQYYDVLNDDPSTGYFRANICNVAEIIFHRLALNKACTTQWQFSSISLLK